MLREKRPNGGDSPAIQVVNFDGDLAHDLLWQGPGGSVVAWFMRGGAVSSAAYVYPGTSDWTVFGAGDVNGDGHGDVLWRSPSGTIVAWLMTGTALSQALYLNPNGLQWTLSPAP